MKEELEKTTQDLGFIIDNLRGALGKSNNVEAIVVLEMIRDARELKDRVDVLIGAYTLDHPAE